MRPRASRRSWFCPEDSPEVTVSEIAFTRQVYLANGALKDCNRLVADGCAKMAGSTCRR